MITNLICFVIISLCTCCQILLYFQFVLDEVQLVEEPVEEVAVAEGAVELRDLLNRDCHFLRVLTA